MDIQKIIHDSLYDFILSYIPDADLSTLDDVILSYITGVLEDLGSQESVEENFDVEVFVEMLEAYIPGFSDIDSVKVCEMMFNLASKLASARDTESGEINLGECTFSLSECSVLTHGDSGAETHNLTSHSDGATANVSESAWDSQEQHLLEMFPKCSVTEARSALSIAKGDMEEAVRLIIEGDVQLKCTASLNAPKKLVRYHGSQVVTTKGERYHLVKKEETEDMKKTYVSLKPARKYRFH
ncbi:CUE domain-containing protein 2 isoform X2 [Xyrauchen texanus]|uniref:CUE domain-containing protein 2 isoform X2 n=1 Tax=Xyrauchen texanus TaxID=154827 RepID=UPI002241CC77|nr:CUE domain-containing protein 2 isoform X2 [Xyrauchen texanus]